MPQSQTPAVARLAPSPTGAQHLGNARTYLLAYWSARASGAKVILRIEDIDSPRVKPWATQQAIDDLKWLGIEWDFGPDIGGPHAPYIQTERVPLYQDALLKLVESRQVYPCTCTRRDIETAASAPHPGDDGPIYPGTCSRWNQGDPLPEAGSFCWRFRASRDVLKFVDRCAGEQVCVPNADLGDFPVTRKTGEAAYQLAVVVDDHEMGVTDVVRGDDLLASTFRQLELYAALGWQPPRFTHVPLVVGTDGRRLAKRHGDTRLSHYRETGVRAIDVVKWAANSAGFDFEEARKANSLEKLHALIIDRFDWRQLPRAPVVVDDGTLAV
jgi:glutamyl-tRNA synthetase